MATPHAIVDFAASKTRGAIRNSPVGEFPGMHPGLRPIDLAHTDELVLGEITVLPSTREILRGGTREVIEPRVMQVLVALIEADGGVVSRDDLVQRCWGGRAISEDAINRCIGRLRRIAETDGGQSFTIQTIPRVGYRLCVRETAAAVSRVSTIAAPDAATTPLLREPAKRSTVMPLLFIVLLALQLGVRLTGVAGGISGAAAVSDGVLLLTGAGLGISLWERRWPNCAGRGR